MNFSSSDVTMIGDRIHDINSATKANCNSILVNRNDIKSKKLKELMNILWNQHLKIFMGYSTVDFCNLKFTLIGLGCTPCLFYKL